MRVELIEDVNDRRWEMEIVLSSSNTRTDYFVFLTNKLKTTSEYLIVLSLLFKKKRVSQMTPSNFVVQFRREVLLKLGWYLNLMLNRIKGNSLPPPPKSRGRTKDPQTVPERSVSSVR